MLKWIGIGALLVAVVFTSVVPAVAQEESAQEQEMTTIEKRVYIYEVKGRRDPFVSLIQEVKGPEGGTTGNPLWDNDVSQMRVIAIVHDPEKSYALFGLPDGKFYTITEGMKIGLHGGHVEEILEDSVLIIEEKPNFKGQLMPVDTYLRLRKEEGQ